MDWYQLSGLTAADQNLATYAKDNNIRVYPVTLGLDSEILSNYVNTTGTWQIYNTYDQLAAATGGTHYAATNGNQLVDVYTAIAGQLQETAGGNTQVVLNFGSVNINDVVGGDIRNYMNYIGNVNIPAQETDSTFINRTNTTPSGAMTVMYKYSQDDTVNWSHRNMNYNVGTVKLNETWAATFRLNLTQAGKIQMFGPTDPSNICFTDAATSRTTCQFIPPLECDIQQSKTNIAFGDHNLSVANLNLATNSLNPNILAISWNISYDGNMTATETPSYQNKDIPGSLPIPIDGGMRFEQKCDNVTETVTVDTTSWPTGNYHFTVFASATDAKKQGVLDGDWTKVGPTSEKFIKLE
jgi:hypothetical protein